MTRIEVALYIWDDSPMPRMMVSGKKEADFTQANYLYRDLDWI